MRYTKEKYIEECSNYHNNKYDYSLIDLKDKKIKIICPQHGVFEQNKSSHKKYGCWKCSVEFRSKMQSLGNHNFINKSIEIHGDVYDYSLVEYKNNLSRVYIICKVHNIFSQTPASHMSGNGCPKCGTESMVLKQRHDTNKFIDKSKKVHGNRYDYSKVKYINNNFHVDIICKEHGDFKQLSSNHLSGQGCPKCVGKSLTTEEIIEKCKKTHENKYNYSIQDEKIIIICKNHGEFSQKLNNHLNLKQGCPKCVGLNKTTYDFIKESKKIHGDIYDYSKTNYKLAKNKVIIICKKHGEFKQAPTHHLSGQSCPVCKCSKGEKSITDFLLEKSINFIHHYVFDDFKNHEFDFFIPDIQTCVEYDGVQHFKPIKYFGGQKAFDNQKIRDKMKDEYCLSNNIHLLRISYTDNINEKLKTLLQ